MTEDPTKEELRSVGDLDLVHPGVEERTDLSRLHPYAGAAVASPRLGGWKAAAGLAALAVLAAVFAFGFLEGDDSRGADEPSPDHVVGAVLEEPASVSAAQPVAPVDQRTASEVLETVAAWASAWSAQEVDEYLSFYAAVYRPPGGLSRNAWNETRRQRIARPRRIEVRITELETRRLASQRYQVSFHQHYESDDYVDGVRKILELTRVGDRWQIVAERTEP